MNAPAVAQITAAADYYDVYLACREFHMTHAGGDYVPFVKLRSGCLAFYFYDAEELMRLGKFIAEKYPRLAESIFAGVKTDLGKQVIWWDLRNPNDD